jgi:hypothetical protein
MRVATLPVLHFMAAAHRRRVLRGRRIESGQQQRHLRVLLLLRARVVVVQRREACNAMPCSDMQCNDRSAIR